MKLLIVTQAVDESDIYLSFFTGWIRAFSEQFESVDVICLKEGTHSLPSNVRVFSLGKESGTGRLGYVLKFVRYIWTLRGHYDAAFVHMNQEYVLLGGILFAFMGKPVYLWRNHYAGSWLTGVAAFMCRKVFYTSKFSYTARYAHAVRMPVGADTSRFIESDARRVPRSILFFARFAPSKRPDVFVRALALLKQRHVPFTASVVGSALPQDEKFRERVVLLARDHKLEELTFSLGVPNEKAPDVYATHDIFVDLGSSGMYNKMLFEAGASGCIVLSASKDYQDELGTALGFREDHPEELVDVLQRVLAYTPDERRELAARMRAYVAANSLSCLAQRLATEIS